LKNKQEGQAVSRKRKTYSPDFKAKVVLASKTTIANKEHKKYSCLDNIVMGKILKNT
jgi:DNA-binding XRE family transcriptional regulator